MPAFASLSLPADPTATAPDGSAVRVLLSLGSGSMAHFALAAGQVSKAVVHRTVEEIWFVLSGRGEMWREQAGVSVTTALHAGVCLTIPLGTCFQFRAVGDEPLAAIAITMPPWPGESEAMIVSGEWAPTL